MFVIEFLGLPGSGKTYVYKNLITYLRKNKFTVIEPKKFFIKKILLDEKNFIKKFTNFIYFIYSQKISLESKKIFKKQYSSIIKKINLKKKILTKNEIRAINIYNYYLSKSRYSSIRKKRSFDNFLIELISIKEALKMYNKNENIIILLDEGFFQKIYLNFKNLNYKKFSSYLKQYFNFLPRTDLVVFKNQSMKKNINIVNQRNSAFRYYDHKNNKVLGNPMTFNKEYKKIIKNKKINFYKYKNKKIMEFNFKKILKEIKN